MKWLLGEHLRRSTSCSETRKICRARSHSKPYSLGVRRGASTTSKRAQSLAKMWSRRFSLWQPSSMLLSPTSLPPLSRRIWFQQGRDQIGHQPKQSYKVNEEQASTSDECVSHQRKGRRNAANDYFSTFRK